MRLGWVFGISLLATLLHVQAFGADEVGETSLPKSQLLSCGSQCAKFSPAKPLKHDIPEFPLSEVSGFYNTNSEGYVWLRYIVGANGKTHDIAKIYELGNPAFSQRSIDIIKNWTFEPALMNGKPAVQSKLFSQNFTIQNPAPVRPAILDAYNRAETLFDGGKLDEADAVLQGALAGLRLSLLERRCLPCRWRRLRYAEKIIWKRADMR
jgi:hypothetical protein